MFSFKHVIVFAILHEKLSHSIDWIPISSPKVLQSYYQLWTSSEMMSRADNMDGTSGADRIEILWEKDFHVAAFIDFTQNESRQNYLGRELQIMKPPYVIREFRPSVDIKKSKTQTFYKATLPVHQSPVYEFRYKIHDPKEENYQEKSEVRVGDSVKGYYSVREPNGYIRLVRYVSDENGFQTQVSHHHVDDNDGGGYLFTGPRYIA